VRAPEQAESGSFFEKGAAVAGRTVGTQVDLNL